MNPRDPLLEHLESGALVVAAPFAEVQEAVLASLTDEERARIDAGLELRRRIEAAPNRAARRRLLAQARRGRL